MLRFEEVPISKEKDINPQATTWADGKCVKIDEGEYITYFAAHEKGVRREMRGEKMDETVEVEIMLAVPVRIEKNAPHSDFFRACPPDVYDEVLPMYVADHIASYMTEKIHALERFDKSSVVNSFLLNGKEVWLDKDTRVGLMNSTQITKAAGQIETTLWFNGFKLTAPCDLAIAMLSQLEMYALACYNRTEEHRAAIWACKDPQSLIDYDFSTGYPERLSFNL